LGLSRNTVSKYPDCTGLWGVVKFDMWLILLDTVFSGYN
jgi:hypothetical protein